MIRIEHTTLKIHRQTLLQDVSLHVAEGDKLAVRGASGCGKSSLLKCILGAIPLAGGRITVDALELSPDTLATIRSCIAFIGQEPILGADTVRDALWLPFRFKAHRDKPPSDQRINELLGRLKLSPDILGKESKRISGGEKQRIAVIRALLLGKRIFIADEVTSALDPESKAAVMADLFRPEITLLSASHDPEWVAACNRTVKIQDGKLQEDIGHKRSQETQERNPLEPMRSCVADKNDGGEP